MTSSIQSLRFDSDYEFDVIVLYDNERFAGKLSLMKESAHLVIFAEKRDGQQTIFPWDHIGRVECSEFNATITLFDLRFMSGSSRIIRHNPPKDFFESTYEVGSVLFSKTQFAQNRSFRGINIHSDTISNWLGNTKKQEEIIGLFYSRQLLNGDGRFLLEFSCEIPGIGVIQVRYNPKIFHSSPDFKAGFSFHPSLFVFFSQALSAEEALQVTAKIIAFFKFITGGNIELS